MRQKTSGFTLIELLIVIAIIGILAAVLIPNLLNARARAFDTAAQTCLKEIAAQEEITASVDPWEYTAGDYGQTAALSDNGVNSCNDVEVTVVAHSDGTAGADLTTYAYNGYHAQGENQYNIEAGSGVTFVGAAP